MLSPLKKTHETQENFHMFKGSSSSKDKIVLTENQKEVLISISQASKTSQGIAKRAQIILRFSKGESKYQLVKDGLGSHPTINKWIKVWRENQNRFKKTKSNSEIKNVIFDVLKDAQRPGAPPKFKEYEVCNIIALACTQPEDEGVPLSHWSCRTLAKEAVRKGLVKSISFRHVANFLKSGKVKAS